MFPDIPSEQITEVVEACAEQLLWEAGVSEPPIDACHVADASGMVVVNEDGLSHRGRFVRVSEAGRCTTREVILVGRDERPERKQWAIAHEVGESAAQRVFAELGTHSEKAAARAREWVASALATCLLLPRRWFSPDAQLHDWDLMALKQKYATASHELIARRMLQMQPPIIVTMCDQGTLTWRRSNVTGTPPVMSARETSVWQQVHRLNSPITVPLDPGTTGFESTRCWPVHEPGWQREIMRTQIAEWGCSI